MLATTARMAACSAFGSGAAPRGGGAAGGGRQGEKREIEGAHRGENPVEEREMERPELIRAAEAEAKAARHSHPWNPKSEMVGVQLARLAGLKRTGVSLARIPPGKESF